MENQQPYILCLKTRGLDRTSAFERIRGKDLIASSAMPRFLLGGMEMVGE